MKDWKDLLYESYLAAKESPDLSTQNGAILVDYDNNIVSSDCNRLPKGVKLVDSRLQRPEKYNWTNHAERTVINTASKNGICTDGLTMVCGWAACSTCAQTIIDSGIVRLVTHEQALRRSPKKWMKEVEIGLQMFAEAGVKVVIWSGEIGGIEIRHCGEIWKP